MCCARFLALLVLAAGVVTVTPELAPARPLVIASCGSTGSAEGWAVSNSSPSTLTAGIECPPVSGNQTTGYYNQTGIHVGDRLIAAGGGNFTPQNATAAVTFTPAPQTTITRFQYQRAIAKQYINEWNPYIAADGTPLDSCEFTNGATNCSVGTEHWHPSSTDPDDGVADVAGLSATSLQVGITCRPNSDGHCANGYSMSQAEADIYEARITMDDPTAPTLSAPGGPAWTAAGWQSGTLPLTISATDNTGIAQLRVYVDGSLMVAQSRSCSYTRPVPCTDASSETIDVPTAELADGAHTLQVAAADAAGNETRLQRPSPLQVDNHAPGSPGALSVDATTKTTNNFSVSWTIPSDTGTAIAGARYQLCSSSSCSSQTDAPSATSIPALSLPNAGTYTLRVWQVDALGHADPATAATINLTYSPTPVPGSSSGGGSSSSGDSGTGTGTGSPSGGSTPPARTSPSKSSASLKVTTLRRRGREVLVAGTLTRAATGRVTIRYQATAGGHTRTLTKRVTIKTGRFKATLTLASAIARAHRATITVSYSGNAKLSAAERHATLRS